MTHATLRSTRRSSRSTSTSVFPCRAREQQRACGQTGAGASAVDAVMAEAAVRTRAGYLITFDPQDMTTLVDHGGETTHVIAV